ncbi:TonB-dependent receptor plug domain-containing protein [Catenovulum agarivorans]|uniref:TonB-dependent receptor plug domain-containing protein n=1 Tax=Catenovulum agarivorans TaxID=1172192 RepID=UPI000370DB44|nr:TonB-dependent receptor plug domain-containing protein [Catenovulum agarivorans]
MMNQYRFNKIACSVTLGLLVSSQCAFAEENNDALIEEVVATASRLQGSAAAVIEERKSQAFVADILGAEQLSRTGDSDAASALRRVTGLTLVDGKFIYVRGLGERYSSARLNGASIPSPDLTRNVVPLDIFPSSIIESLSVQKAYSPSMPAAFGGGSIDIRTKSVPTEFIAGFEIGAGIDSSASDGFSYERNDSGLNASLYDAIAVYRGDFSLSSIIEEKALKPTDTQTAGQQALLLNKQLLRTLPRDLEIEEESLDPNYNIKAHIGDSFEVLDGQLGFLASVAYDSIRDASEKRNAIITNDLSENCATSLDTVEQVDTSCYEVVKDSVTSTENERLNAVFNVGYKREGHQVSWSNIYLEDNEDEVDVSILQAPAASSSFAIIRDGSANRSHEFLYEERTLSVSQFQGKHTFLDFGGLGFDWQYTRSKAETDIPVDVTYKFGDKFNSNGEYVNSVVSGDDNRAVYSYTNMEDHVDSYSGNLNLPVYLSDFEMEFKAGYDFVDRARIYSTSSFAVNLSGAAVNVDNGGNPLNNSGYLTDSFIDNSSATIQFNEPTSPRADDYLAAQKVAAGYGMFDVIYQGQWRVSGGLRYEEFQQVSIGTSSLIFDGDDLDIYYDPEKIQAGTINEDETYSALSLTYIGGESYQIRFGYGETVVRPDLREVVPVSYTDPLTDIRTFGRSGLKSSPIKNYDLRYEYYGSLGDSFSVAAFYKDIDAPIETVLQIGDEEYSATFVNGESAEVMGVEIEWMHDLTYLADGIFTSGNITLSDSEAVIDPAQAGSLTNPTKRMTGHSEYVVNLQLNYDSSDGEHSSSLVYNVFGERILAAGVLGREDAMEQPFHSLDFVYTYYPDFNSKVKFKMKNLLNEDQEVTQSGVTVRSKEIGLGASLSYSYEF